MFTKLKNIETAFRYIRMFSIFMIISALLFSALVSYWCWQHVEHMQDRIYILTEGKVLQALASKRSDNIPVEAKEHVRRFHQDFFTLDPDDQAIEHTIDRALYLADESAKRSYDNLRVHGYFADLVAGNINQTIQIDSILLNTEDYPYAFHCYAKQQIVRPENQTTRLLVTQGRLRLISRSANNPHGFLIEQWRTVENRDLKTERRR